MGQNLVTEILDILFSGFANGATAIPQALGQAITSFMTTSTTVEGVTTTHLSDAGQIIVVFASISLLLSLVYLGINFVFSWGHNR